jgi:hypothetical protein
MRALLSFCAAWPFLACSFDLQEDFDPCCRRAFTRIFSGSASKDAGFTIISMPTEQKNMSMFSTLTLLNFSDHDKLSRGLEPTLLICGVKNASSVFYNSLKRQKPTRHMAPWGWGQGRIYFSIPIYFMGKEIFLSSFLNSNKKNLL